MDDTIDYILKEIKNNLKEMSRCQDIDKKKKLAEITKLLCESIGVFFDGMNMIDNSLYNEDFDDDEHAIPFYDDSIVDIKSLKDMKNKKKKKKD